MEPTARGWVAGLLEGEGAFSRDRCIIEIKQKDYGSQGPLERLVELVGGQIYPAYNNNCRQKWYLHGPEAIWLARLIFDLMSERRQQQISVMLAAAQGAKPQAPLRKRPPRRVPKLSAYWERWRREHPNCKQHGIPRDQCERCIGGGKTAAPVLAGGT